MVSDASAILSGMIVSAGTVLAVAGASKVCGTVRGTEADSAIRRALGVALRRWRLAELGAGTAECVTGAIVCSGLLPAPGGAAMAGLGAAFTGLLLYARRTRAAGGCGCFRWGGAAPGVVTWRAITRAGLVLAAGVVCTARPTAAPPPFFRPWFYAGYAGGLIILASMSEELIPERLVCSWRRWRPAGRSLAALAEHPVFRAMAGSVGPFGTTYGHRSGGCSEEYWFATPFCPQNAHHVVAFHVRHLPRGGLAVHASLQAHLPRIAHWRKWPGSLASFEEPQPYGQQSRRTS
jgi:hypothetical protein